MVYSKQGKTHGNELGIVLKTSQLIFTMLETLEKIPYTEFEMIQPDWADPFIRENGHQPLLQNPHKIKAYIGPARR